MRLLLRALAVSAVAGATLDAQRGAGELLLQVRDATGGAVQGFREAYVNGSVAAHYGRHERKVGAEASFASIDEAYLKRTGRRSLRLQADVFSVTDRLNVTNFAGLFSGTAIGAPRSGALRLRFEF